jgi:diguanylate cyclase (GGDEF)-like protein/PAS domain S-box-containing protein
MRTVVVPPEKIVISSANPDSRLASFNRITSDSTASLAEKIDRLLAAGCRAFAMSLGLLARVDGERYEIVHAVSSLDALSAGVELALAQTYCAATLRSGAPRGFHRASGAERQHPHFLDFGIEAYLGVPVLVARSVWGSLSFGHTAAMAEPFDDDDVDFLLMLAQWIGNQLEREQKQSELLQLAEWQRTIVDSANLSIIATDIDGVIVSFNPAAERMLGYRAEEAIGQTPQFLHDADEVARRAAELSAEIGEQIAPGFAVFAAKARLGIAEEREWSYLRKDGSRFPVLLSVTALHDTAGRIRGYLGIGVDISERKKLHQARAEAQANELARALILAVPDGIVGLEARPPHRIHFMNPQAEKLLGIDQSVAVGRAFAELATVAPEGQGAVAWPLSQWLTAPGAAAVQAWVEPLGGAAAFPAELAFSHVANSNGTALEVLTLHDISARRQAESALRESEARFRSIFEWANAGIAFTDAAGNVEMANESLSRLLGYSSDELLGMNFGPLTHPDDLAQEMVFFDEILAGKRNEYHLEKRYFRKDGSELWADLTVNVIRDEAGLPVNFVGLVADISDRKQSEESLNLMAKVFTTSGEGIVITDAKSNIVATNDAFTRLTGYSEDEVVGRNPRILSAGRTPPEVFARMWADLTQHGSWEGELWDRRKTGEPYQKWLSINAVRDRKGRITHYIGSFTDITERKTSEERMLFLAHHDALTQLPNRLSLQERLESAIQTARRGNTRLALMLIDLDRFKAINDTLGHHIGDQLLIEVANRLLESVRETDVVARFGGDEFIVLLTGIEAPGDAVHVADKIVRSVSAPYMIAGNDLRTSPSIGICIYPDDAEEIGDLIKSGDVAMYHAKAKGRGNYQFFTEELNQAVIKRQSIEADLRTALEQQQFVLHYQPQLDLRSGRIVGLEALIRWQHPVRGLVPPVSFISIAEETGLIIPLGDWVLREACRQLKAWQDQGVTDLRMSVNLSASQFLDKELPLRIRAILEEIDLEPRYLDLEVTESMSMASPDDAIEMMRSLAETGMTLSIDDFGTGYSSLAYLKLFPIHSLKIDRSFVKDIETDANDAEICDVTVLLAHKLGLEVVAEGVENEAQLKYLISIGCEKYQGYFLSKPLPAEAAMSFIKAHVPMPEVGQVDLWQSG